MTWSTMPSMSPFGSRAYTWSSICCGVRLYDFGTILSGAPL